MATFSRLLSLASLLVLLCALALCIPSISADDTPHWGWLNRWINWFSHKKQTPQQNPSNSVAKNIVPKTIPNTPTPMHHRSVVTPTTPSTPTPSSANAYLRTDIGADVSPQPDSPFEASLRNRLFNNLMSNFGLPSNWQPWHINSTAFVLPFTRSFESGDRETEVSILQQLLRRSGYVTQKPNVDGVFGPTTQTALKEFQLGALSAYYTETTAGVFDGRTSQEIVRRYESDGYEDDGTWPLQYQWKAKLFVYPNKMIDTVGKFMLRTPAFYAKIAAMPDKGASVAKNDLNDEDLAELDGTIETFYFISKTAGQPTVHKGGDIRNQFANDGTTPTGLYAMDFTTPHPETSGFGPYPINSLMYGIKGNAGMQVFYKGGMATLYPNVRSGVYFHTGYWGDRLDHWYDPSNYMPVSHGCIHTHPNAIRHVWDVLAYYNITAAQHGTKYTPRGLYSIELITSISQEVEHLGNMKGYWTQNNQISNHEWVLPAYNQAAKKEVGVMLAEGPSGEGPKTGYVASRPQYDMQERGYIAQINQRIGSLHVINGNAALPRADIDTQ